MPTPYTTPFTATTGSVISSADHNAGVRDNILHFRDFLPDPASANLVLISQPGLATAAWQQVGSSVIANQAVGTAALQDLGVTTGKLAAGAVDTSKIADGNVTSGKLAASAVTAGKIAAGAVGSTEIADGNVGTNEIADGNVTPAKLSAAVAQFPLGGVCWFETLAEVTAAGALFARYTAADGRILVAAGTAASPAMGNPITFTQATNYGADWQPTIPVPSHIHALTNDPSVNLTHAGSDVVATGNQTGDVLSGTNPSVSIVPALRAGIWARRIA